MAKNLGHLTIDFSQMMLSEVYAMHNATFYKMKVREGTLIKKFQESNNTISNMKHIFILGQ